MKCNEVKRVTVVIAYYYTLYYITWPLLRIFTNTLLHIITLLLHYYDIIITPFVTLLLL